MSLERILLVGGVYFLGACSSDISLVPEPEACPWSDAFLQPAPTDGVDVLWIIDGSGSMVDNETQLTNGLGAMLNALPVEGWRLNMISTDPTAVLYDQQFPLIPGVTVTDAQLMYKRIYPGVYEMGFDALMSYVQYNSYAATWMRASASLLVVFVSDEEEQSALSVSDFEDWYSTYRLQHFVSSIVNFRPDNSSCNFVEADAGLRYIDATNFFNGVTIDICSDDWSKGVKDATKQINPYDALSLQYQPIEETLGVLVDGQPLSQSAWEYDNETNTVYFSEIPLGGSLVEIVYNIDEGTVDECPLDVE